MSTPATVSPPAPLTQYWDGYAWVPVPGAQWYPPPVEIARPVDPDDDYLSPTQLETFDSCPRKWGWRKLDGIETPGNASAQFGVNTHAMIADWLTKGIPLDLTREEGECAMSGYHLWPAPRTPGMQVEEPFTLVGWGHRYYGVRDIAFLNRTPPKVTDHKTTKDFKWAKTAENLGDNIQAAIYAADAMVRASSNTCELEWIYYRTKRPYKVLVVNVIVTRERIAPTLEKVRRLSDDIRLIKLSGLRAIDLPFNPATCEAYGGCPFKSLCNLQPSDVLRAIMSSEATSISQSEKDALYARIAERTGGGGTGINPPAGPPPPPPAGAIPPGAQRSPDGKHYLDPVSNTWQPVPAANAAPPPPPASGKRGPGRPRKNAPAPSAEDAGISTAEDMLASAYETIAEGYTAAAEAIRRGALKPE